MSTKGIVVKGLVIHCRAGWTVEKALHEMRKRHGLQHGGIEEDGVAVSGDEVIGDLAGTLVFVGGEPVQQIGKHHCFPNTFFITILFKIHFSVLAPIISGEMICHIIDRVTEGVSERATERVAKIIWKQFPTVPETEVASPPLPVESIPQIPPPPDQGQVYNWEEYIPHHTDIPPDFYLNKLQPRFQAVNGTERFRLIKHPLSIVIKDDQNTIFRCSRAIPSDQRNLYLEFHECGYSCEGWVERFLKVGYEKKGAHPLHSAI